MTKMVIDMAVGSALTIGLICFLNSKDGKKLRCKIAKVMN